MEFDRADRLIKGISYKPGWTLQLREWGAGLSELSVVFPSLETDRRRAPDYAEKIVMAPSTLIYLGDIASEEDLYARVFQFILQVETHEAREFFGVDGDRFYKPLHPHTPAGEKRWSHYKTQMQDAVASS